MSPLEIRQYIDSFINHERCLHQVKRKSFTLERVQRLLKDLGNPQNHLKIIHAAGSKGKGSICALVASILQKSGYRVGLYTSPHINSYRERIRVLTGPQSSADTEDVFSDMISEEELGAVLEEIRPAVDKAVAEKAFGNLSFFELFTVLALCHFYKQNVDFAVLETGLGGRLDATNTVDSLVAVLTPVSREHTHILGKTIPEITQEKAAVIKNHKQKVVIAPQTKAAGKVFKSRCHRFDIQPVWIEDSVYFEEVSQNIDRQTFDLTTPKMRYRGLTLPLLGKHQRENAASAISVVECLHGLGFSVPTDSIHKGLKNVFWPGRFEIIRGEPLIVLDGAHNESSVKALIDLMNELFKNRRIILVLGVSLDKNKELIYAQLKKIADDIIFTKANHPRAHDFPGAFSVADALDAAFAKSGREDVLLVTGSIFVVSEARRILKGIQNVPA